MNPKNYLSFLFFTTSIIALVCESNAQCANGITGSPTAFTKCPLNPVLKVGNNTWDNFEVEGPTIIKLANGTYNMWYEGEDTTYYPDRMGLATSVDGINWTKNPVPVINGAANTWEHYGVAEPAIIIDGATYKMWYSSGSPPPNTVVSLGYATSPDGVNWTKHTANPVMTAGPAGSFDEKAVLSPHVIKDSNIYKMWYTGWDNSPLNLNRIGYATSTDGINWTKFSSNAVIDLGTAPGAFDKYSCASPWVIKDSSVYHMWYVGVGDAPDYTWTIGYASSPDGINWSKYSGNPILSPSNTPSWDSAKIGAPAVIKDNGFYKIWFAAHQSKEQTLDKAQIGYAGNFFVSTNENNSSAFRPVLYPNPASGFYTIEADLPTSAYVEIAIIDILGNEVYTENSTANNHFKKQINITHLPAGFYLMRITTNTDSFVQKFIIGNSSE